MKHCSKCGENKPIDQFYKDKERKDGLRCICKTCESAYKKNYRLRNSDKIKKQSKIYRNNHPHLGVGQYIKYRDKMIKYGADRRLRIKTDVLTHYGGDKCACVKCGFNNIIALTIDHINGDGANHRKENRYASGNHIYELLKRQGYPEGYQTLCMNCQLIKRQENHEYIKKHTSIDLVEKENNKDA